MLTDLVRRRSLIWAFAERDFATRYRSSALGWIWSLAQPLATLVIFTAVFALVFRIQAPPLGNDPERSSFAAFLFTGLITWNLFQGLVNLSMVHLEANADLLRKVHFPSWAPLLGASIVQFIQVALELVVLVAMFLWLGNVGITWLLAIPLLVATALFGQGIGLMLAMANARYGDVQYVVAILLGGLYFLTPILYPLSFIDGANPWLVTVVEGNPMTWFVESMHTVMYSLQPLDWWVTPALLAFGFFVFWAGLAIFNRASADIGEIL